MTNDKMIGTKKITFKLIEQKETKDLAIVLPGAGYPAKAPLLHYATGLFYNKGFDVLHINYTYDRNELLVLDEADFKKDVQLVINNAIRDKEYSTYYVVAKSVGTIALSHLLNQPMLQDAKLVWLTPLIQREDVFHAMLSSGHKGIGFIGNKDHYFDADRLEQLKMNRNLILRVIDGGNHSLELDEDPIQSIDLLKSIITEMNAF